MSKEPHIVIESVGAVYDAAGGDLVALESIDLSFERGEFVSIIGPSGCGKSTLLRIVGGLMAPTAGRVLVDGKAPREAQREKQVGFVFQDPSLLPWSNVSDNVRRSRDCIAPAGRTWPGVRHWPRRPSGPLRLVRPGLRRRGLGRQGLGRRAWSPWP